LPDHGHAGTRSEWQLAAVAASKKHRVGGLVAAAKLEDGDQRGRDARHREIAPRRAIVNITALETMLDFFPIFN
jgi:hypothetical protein